VTKIEIAHRSCGASEAARGIRNRAVRHTKMARSFYGITPIVRANAGCGLILRWDALDMIDHNYFDLRFVGFEL
jgi:hypothetical protein